MGLAPLHNSRVTEQDRISRLARCRALAVFIAVAGGLFAASLLPAHIQPILLLGAGTLLVAIAIILHRRDSFLVFLLAAIFAFAAGSFQLRIRNAGGDDLGPRIEQAAELTPNQSAILKLRGTLAAPLSLVAPQAPPLGQFLHTFPAARSTFRVSHIYDSGAWQPISGSLWLKVELAGPSLAPLATFHAGEPLELTGIAHPLRGPSNPGEFDTRDWAADHSIAGSITLSSPELLTPILDSPSLSERVARVWIKGRSLLTTRAHDALDRATSTLSGEDRALLFALVLGDTPTDQSLNQAFLRLGLAHVLAISGFHLVVMVQVFLFLLRLTGDRGRLETVLAILMVIAYMAIIPAQAPIIRSGAICIIMLLAEWLGRRYDTITLLIWIATGLILIHPTDLLSLGYQLSCGLTIILMWLGTRSRAVIFSPHIAGLATPPRPRWHAIRAAIAEHLRGMIATTLLCSLASVPLILYRTGTLSPLVLLATVLIVPLITVLLWLAFIVLALGVAVLPLASFFGPVLRLLADLITWVTHQLDALPFAQLRLFQPDIFWSTTATALILVWFIRGRLRDRVMWMCAAALALWSLIGWGLHCRAENSRTLRVDMLSVGDGSCLILRSNGHTVLWDAGSLRAGMGSDTIARALTALNITHVDAAYITHPDIDHFGGLPPLLRTFGIRQVYTCERFVSQAKSEPRGAAATMISLLAHDHCTVTALAAGSHVEFGGCVIDVLSPPSPEPEWKNDNEHSLIAVISRNGNQLMMLTGDAQEHAIETALAATPHPIALEAPHHGAYTPFADRLVQQTGARVVLQSTSQRREHNQKWEPAQRGVPIWLITSRDGACWIEFTSDATYTTGAFRR